MWGRIAGRLLWGLLVALFLLGGLQLAANQVEPANPGLTEQPCPPPVSRARYVARLALLTLAGRGDQLRDWADLCVFQADNTAIAKAGHWPRAVMIGDSITQYWQLDNPALFGPDLANRGVAGQTSAQVLVRFSADALALKPRIIHLMVGVNDVTGKRGPSRAEDYRNNIRAMTTLAKAEGITVILGLIPPAIGDGADQRAIVAPKIRALNGWLAQFGREQGLILADYWTPLAAPDGAIRPDLAEDGLHPNHAGFARMEPVLRAALNEAGRRRTAD